LATNDHFSSNWTSVVRGGEGDQLVVGRLGVVAGLADVSGHRIAVDSHESLGLADAAAVGHMFEHGEGLLLGQMGMEQRGALAFGEPVATGAATEQADRVVLAVMTADGEVFAATHTMIGTVGIQAAEPRKVIHSPPPATYPGNSAKSCDFTSR
jgi:hypothetical protein